ncbi:MAG: phage tail protein [bacterium]|nr:phage tail protein [bacterium]
MAKTNDTWYPATGFYFKVEVAGITDTYDNSFKEVSGLEVEQGSKKLVEGGVNDYTWELPTQVNSGKLVLKRGLCSKKSGLIKWVEQTVATDYSKPISLKNIIVKLYNKNGKPMITWTFNDTRPIKYSVDNFDSQKNELLVETMEFRYTNYKRTYAN